MLKIPKINTAIVNSTLEPYFDKLYKELSELPDNKRKISLQRYKTYIESKAQKSKSTALRIQLRINLLSLLDKLGEIPTAIEVNVNPSFVKARKYRFFDEAYREILT